MRASEATFLAIDWEMKFGAAFGAVDDHGEPERSIACYDGRIFAFEGGLRRRVGRVSARRCLLGEASPALVLTADPELAAYRALFTRAGRFLDRITRRRGDLLVLDRLGLVSDYRGRGLGLTVIREVTRQLGSGCAVAALIPSPMSYEHVTGQFTRIRDDVAAAQARATLSKARLQDDRHGAALRPRPNHEASRAAERFLTRRGGRPAAGPDATQQLHRRLASRRAFCALNGVPAIVYGNV